MDDANSINEDFTADIALNTIVNLYGSVSMNGSNANVTGFGTSFSSDLKVGDFVTVVGVGDKDLSARLLLQLLVILQLYYK